MTNTKRILAAVQKTKNQKFYTQLNLLSITEDLGRLL